MGQEQSPDSRWQALIAQVIEKRAERDFPAAHELCLQALRAAQEKFGKYHPETIAARVLCGELACRAGRSGVALHHYVVARKLLEQALYPQHPLYAELFKGFAYVYMKQELCVEAAAFYSQAVEVVEAQPEADQAAAAELRLYLGDALRRSGRFDSAQAAYGHALAVFKELGEEGEAYASQALARLGYLQHDLGHFEQALALLEESLYAAENNGDHALKRSVLEMLWSACEHLGAESEALSYRLQILEDEKQAAGDAPARLKLLRELAETYATGGDTANAERTHIEIINLVCNEYGEESAELAEAKQALGELYCMSGNLQQAKVTLNSSLNHYIGAGAKHPSTAAVYHNLGTVFLADGELNDAAMFLKKALRMREQASEMDVAEVSRTLIALGNALLQKQEGVEAQTCFARVLGLDLGDSSEAEELRAHARRGLKALGIGGADVTQVYELEELDLSEMPACEPFDVAEDLSSLGTRFNDAIGFQLNGETARAARSFEDIVAIIEGARGKTHPDLIPALQQLADIYDKLGLEMKAEAARSRIQTITALGATA